MRYRWEELVSGKGLQSEEVVLLMSMDSLTLITGLE